MPVFLVTSLDKKQCRNSAPGMNAGADLSFTLAD